MPDAVIDPAGNCSDEGHELQHIENFWLGCILICLCETIINLVCFFWVIIWYLYSGDHDHLNCYFYYCHDRFYEFNIFGIYWIEKCHVCQSVIVSDISADCSSLAVLPNIFEFINIHYYTYHIYSSRKHLHLQSHHKSIFDTNICPHTRALLSIIWVSSCVWI